MVKFAMTFELDVHCLKSQFVAAVEPTGQCSASSYASLRCFLPPLGLGRTLFLMKSTNANNHAMRVCRRGHDG